MTDEYSCPINCHSVTRQADRAASVPISDDDKLAPKRRLDEYNIERGVSIAFRKNWQNLIKFHLGFVARRRFLTIEQVEPKSGFKFAG